MSLGAFIRDDVERLMELGFSVNTIIQQVGELNGPIGAATVSIASD